MTVYEQLEKELGFTPDQLRRIERLQISDFKLTSTVPPTEAQFITACRKIKSRMRVLQYETILYMMFPPALVESWNAGTPKGPGFMKTQLRENGTHVIARHHYDKHF